MDHFNNNNNFNINTNTTVSKSPIIKPEINSKFTENKKQQQRNISTSMDLSSAMYNNDKGNFQNPNTSLNYSFLGDNINNNFVHQVQNNEQKISNSNSEIKNNCTLMDQKQYLTQAGLEEYSRNFYDSNLSINHQKQSSYAQSEGYHSYVSSTDSTSTPFLDRLRKEGKLQSRINSWPENMNNSMNSHSTTAIFSGHKGSSSTDTSPTKPFNWIDSGSSQLIARSSKVRSPQKHKSESLLSNSNETVAADSSNRSDRSKFHINTYEPPPPNAAVAMAKEQKHGFQSVADRINELNYQMQLKNLNVNKPKYVYLDPSKTQRISNTALKTYQKNCLSSYFERQQKCGKPNSSSGSEKSNNTSLNSSTEETEVTKQKPENINKFNNQILDTEAPPPPPRNRPVLRRTSSVSETSLRDKVLQSKQHLSKDLHGPIIIGQIISVDEWIPERPPKKNSLFPQRSRVPDIDLPPPPPVDCPENTLDFENEPLPSPPKFLTDPDPEPLETIRRNSFAGQGNTMFSFRSMENALPTLPPRAHELTTIGAKELPPRRSLNNNWNFAQPPVILRNSSINNKIPIGANYNIDFKTDPTMAMKTITDARLSDSRLSIRKRAHNSNDSNVLKQLSRNISNSKNSYLPTEHRNKNLSPDLDHGSYKLTSNELNSNVKNDFPDDLLKYPLPDVLPKVYKSVRPERTVQQHHQSQEFPSYVPDYHSMENLASQTAPVIPTSSKSVFHFQKANVVTNVVKPEMKASFSTSNLNSNHQVTKFDGNNSDVNASCTNMFEASMNTQNFDEKCDKIATVRKITMVESNCSDTSAEVASFMENGPIESSLNNSRADNDDDDDDCVPQECPISANASELCPVESECENVVTQPECTELNELKLDLWTRKKHPEEYDCEKLTELLVSQLSPSDKLQSILVPKKLYSSSDYISDLFNNDDVTSRNVHEKLAAKSSFEVPASDNNNSEVKSKVSRFNREMTLIQGDTGDLTKKKEELVSRMSKKLVVLSNEQTILTEEQSANNILGNEVAITIAQKGRPIDSTKFRGYVEDLGHIILLLLSLSGRLAKIENTLHNSNNLKVEDRKILENKRDRLFEQLKEAKLLKKDIDRRGRVLSDILEKVLTVEEFADFNYFVSMKAKLIMDSREIEERISFSNEQIVALRDTIQASDC